MGILCIYMPLFRVIFAVVYGGIMAGKALSFAPEYLSAKVSASLLFKLLDQKSDIDFNYHLGKVIS